MDPDRVGIIGGSYGGYMTLAALTLQPDAFAVGVDLFGISNWVRTLESIPKWWESQREALYEEIGDPVKDREMLLAVSPLFHADRIRKPLVLQGANDPRVIKPESESSPPPARTASRSSMSCSPTRGTASPRRRTRSKAGRRSSTSSTST